MADAADLHRKAVSARGDANLAACAVWLGVMPASAAMVLDRRAAEVHQLYLRACAEQEGCDAT